MSKRSLLKALVAPTALSLTVVLPLLAACSANSTEEGASSEGSAYTQGDASAEAGPRKYEIGGRCGKPNVEWQDWHAWLDESKLGKECWARIRCPWENGGMEESGEDCDLVRNMTFLREWMKGVYVRAPETNMMACLPISGGRLALLRDVVLRARVRVRADA
jgi:hypothetical protein